MLFVYGCGSALEKSRRIHPQFFMRLYAYPGCVVSCCSSIRSLSSVGCIATPSRSIAVLLGAEGRSVEVVETLSAQSAGDQARQGIEEGFDTILVCGGDGTVFNVIQGVAGTEIPVGILPFGTGNVLAQNLNLPRNPVEAARKLLLASPKRIPLGRITMNVTDLPSGEAGRSRSTRTKSWYFTMAAGMGLHASLLDIAEAWGKRGIGRASYFLAGTSLLLRHRIQPFEVEVTPVSGVKFRQRVCEAIAVRVAELNRWRPERKPGRSGAACRHSSRRRAGGGWPRQVFGRSPEDGVAQRHRQPRARFLGRRITVYGCTTHGLSAAAGLRVSTAACWPRPTGKSLGHLQRCDRDGQGVVLICFGPKTEPDPKTNSPLLSGWLTLAVWKAPCFGGR